ncbi:NUDIX hydrolase [Candidatus Woesearchaeota archaeon]|nr:NUDIX hydrolase [Candidatus Woesearchaeota archaeon]
MDDRGNMQVAVDAVCFTVMHDELKILLIQRKYEPFQGGYAIPGGFVKKDEELEDAVKRELAEETGVTGVFLKQLGAYGKVDRDPRGRILSVAFAALISPHQRLQATTDAMAAEWFAIDNLPKLAFDHDKIIAEALDFLRFELQTTNIANQVLPEFFTLSQLQGLYESVLGKKLDKRNFRRRIKEMDVLKETDKTHMEGAHRPAKLYTFKDKEYTTLKARIQVFV